MFVSLVTRLISYSLLSGPMTIIPGNTPLAVTFQAVPAPTRVLLPCVNVIVPSLYHMLNMLLDLVGYPCPPLSMYLLIFTDINIFFYITE
ncbi:hypothetical protein, partial [Escherichia coli]|uniref:hypothetical protein n=1 Tax=Escherichia coli TaxID=562 RepID=UPI001BCA35FD